jgi:glucan phosphoethanolaminetransferase (alkaline phosphatase superfamily)
MNTLQVVATVSIIIAFVCAIIIVIDLLNGNKQHMMIMNFVWPITALYGGPLALIAYYTIGRKSSHKKMMEANKHGQRMPSKQKPFWQSVTIGALHCGSGCTLGDMIAETFLLAVPVILFGSKIYGSWAIDFLFAFIIGIVFQYYSIKPMKNLSPKKGLIAALKADTLSLTAWQVGMYGGMAIAFFLIFKRRLEPTNILFWFVMQGAMLLGFITSFPVNRWLLKRGIKEVM